MKPSDYPILTIARGQISGTYADSFHYLSRTGKTGYHLDRDPYPEEKERMLSDLRRHREVLVQELTNLALAERLLRGI